MKQPISEATTKFTAWVEKPQSRVLRLITRQRVWPGRRRDPVREILFSCLFLEATKATTMPHPPDFIHTNTSPHLQSLTCPVWELSFQNRLRGMCRPDRERCSESVRCSFPHKAATTRKGDLWCWASFLPVAEVDSSLLHLDMRWRHPRSGWVFFPQ